MGKYYNLSDEGDMSPTGTPYGFHARALQGYSPGFPVLFENVLSNVEASRLVTYLLDGSFVDSKVGGWGGAARGRGGEERGGVLGGRSGARCWKEILSPTDLPN